MVQRILELIGAKLFESGWACEVAEYVVCREFYSIGLGKKKTDQTDQHTAAVPVPSVNISERPSVHRAGGSRLQLVANSYERIFKNDLHFFYRPTNTLNFLVKP